MLMRGRCERGWSGDEASVAFGAVRAPNLMRLPIKEGDGHVMHAGDAPLFIARSP